MDNIIQICSKVLGCVVTLESSIENIPGWDSLKTLQLVMALDEEGYSIPLEKIAKIYGISDIVEFARKRK